jgi:hypothetical protein
MAKDHDFLLRRVPPDLDRQWNIASAAYGDTKRDFLLKCLEEGIKKMVEKSTNNKKIEE